MITREDFARLTASSREHSRPGHGHSGHGHRLVIRPAGQDESSNEEDRAMRISVDQSVELTPASITSHVYGGGSAYLELGTRGTVHQSITIWVGRKDADLAEEARALRKLAEVASDLAAGLESRDGAPRVS